MDVCLSSGSFELAILTAVGSGYFSGFIWLVFFNEFSQVWNLGGWHELASTRTWSNARRGRCKPINHLRPTLSIRADYSTTTSPSKVKKAPELCVAWRDLPRLAEVLHSVQPRILSFFTLLDENPIDHLLRHIPDQSMVKKIYPVLLLFQTKLCLSGGIPRFSLANLPHSCTILRYFAGLMNSALFPIFADMLLVG